MTVTGGTAALFPAEPASNQLTMPLADVLARAPADWAPLVQAWQASPDGSRLQAFVAGRQAAGACIYPAEPLRALALTPRAAVRVVLLGQDPYHGAGPAEGLAFSVPVGVKAPPSLRNILGEISRSLGVPHPPSGQLGGWARQGVLLLNTVLTVEDAQPAAHAGRGWEHRQRPRRQGLPAVGRLCPGQGRADRRGRWRAASGAAGQSSVAAVGPSAPVAVHRLRPLHPGT